MENESIFQEIYANEEFVFNKDPIRMNITIWRRATTNLDLCDCQIIISIFGLNSLLQLQSLMKDQYVKSKCYIMKSSMLIF